MIRRKNVLSTLTLFSAVGSALCWGWWKYRVGKASAALAEAAQKENWADYQTAIRNEWPALDWLIGSLILLFLAIATGAVALLYWTIWRRGTRSSDSR